MLENRRKFIERSISMTVGLGLFTFLETMAHDKSPTLYDSDISKGEKELIEIRGIVCNSNQIPISDTEIEVWHSNSENDEEIFQHKFKTKTNAKGEYSFITKYPKKHFESGFYRMRRVFMKINNKSEIDSITKLYLGSDKAAYIDNHHFELTTEKFKNNLPKTEIVGKNLIIRFDIFLNL